MDHMLIRREILMREGNKVIREDSKENEEMDSTLSYINPFSNSEDLCNQVLQLAKNVSRFEQTPEEPVENGYLKKAKKKKLTKKKFCSKFVDYKLMIECHNDCICPC